MSSNVHPSLFYAQMVLDSVTQSVVGRPAIVTSVEDGRHTATSLHYRGRALDLRTRDLSHAQKRKYAIALRSALGPGWEVIIESDHIHVEYEYQHSEVAVDQ